MNEQKIPGVRKPILPAISGRMYALLVATVLVVATATAYAVARIDLTQTPGSVTFDLDQSDGDACVYNPTAQQMQIRTSLDATSPGKGHVTLTVGVRNTVTGEEVAKTSKTVTVNGQLVSSDLFRVDLPKAEHADGATACFVENSEDF